MINIFVCVCVFKEYVGNWYKQVIDENRNNKIYSIFFSNTYATRNFVNLSIFSSTTHVIVNPKNKISLNVSPVYRHLKQVKYVMSLYY